jgi:hypothetical protein
MEDYKVEYLFIGAAKADDQRSRHLSEAGTQIYLYQLTPLVNNAQLTLQPWVRN